MKLVILLLLVLQAVTSITAVTITNSNRTETGYDPAKLLAKIFQPNTTESRQRGYGFVNFEDQADLGIDTDNQDPGQYGLIEPDRNQRPLKFQDDYDSNYDTFLENNSKYNDRNRPLKFDSEGDLPINHGINFHDDNKVENQGNKKRRRRRRRKPKNGVLPYPGAVGLPAVGPGINGGPGLPGYQTPFQGEYGLNPYEGYPGVQPTRRPRRPRPRPSLATEALSSITEALTSIARYDDYQCVPRLLCEAAGGEALSNNGVLQSIAGIQPLLTLLSAYNGISTSPLFVFGRAVFLGMTSKGNTGTCRYAYSQCPTDPEQLIHYLNNHNGGFFRFFNAPQLSNQNVEQFYNQLGNQGYGIYQPQQSLIEQGYGYPNQNYGQNLYASPELHKPFGVYNKLNSYSDRNYAYDYNYSSRNQIRFKDSDARIEKRIQNKPAGNVADYEIDSYENDNIKSKWQFPKDQAADVNNKYFDVRHSETLRFPEEIQSYDNQKEKEKKRKAKQVYFPDKNDENYYNNKHNIFLNNNRYKTTTYSYNYGQNNQNYYTDRPTYENNNNYRPPVKYQNYNYNTNNENKEIQNHYYNNKQNIYNNNHKHQPTTVFNNEEYVFDYKHNFYVKKENEYTNNGFNTNNFKRSEDDGLKTVYVVRGNGDPSKPEIVKLRPGQSIY